MSPVYVCVSEASDFTRSRRHGVATRREYRKKCIPTYLPIYTRAYITKKPWLKLCRSCDVNIVILYRYKPSM